MNVSMFSEMRVRLGGFRVSKQMRDLHCCQSGRDTWLRSEKVENYALLEM